MRNNPFGHAALSAFHKLHAGSVYEGQVMFEVIHPLTLVSFKTYSIVDVEMFCKKNQLVFDRDYFDSVISSLEYVHPKGWRVRKEHLNANEIISSCIKFLRNLEEKLKQQEVFYDAPTFIDYAPSANRTK